MKEIIMEFCQNNRPLYFKESTPYHYIILGKNGRLDIYPVNKRYHVVKYLPDKDRQGERGDVNDIKELLTNMFLSESV